MKSLAEFFKGADTTLGVFSPTHHLIAIFRDEQVAAGAAASLIALKQVTADDVIVASGREVLELENSEASVAGHLMQAVSRFFVTEQSFVDHDLEHARHNAGFLIVHCRSEEVRQAAWPVIQAANPLDARYYRLGGVEHLAGDLETH